MRDGERLRIGLTEFCLLGALAVLGLLIAGVWTGAAPPFAAAALVLLGLGHPKTGLRYDSTSSGSWLRRVGYGGKGGSTDSPRCPAAHSPACRLGGRGS